MDPGLSPRQEMFRNMVRDFAEKEVAPRAAAVDAEARFPAETIRMMGALGLMGITIPEEYGGAGADSICYVIAMEEISRACASTGVIMSINNSMVCDLIHKFGDEGQKRRFLIPLARGEQLGCFCLSEPDAGSDAGNLRVTALAEGDHFVLNGAKNFITNGKEADIAIVFATVGRHLKHKGICALVVEKGTPGFHVLKEENKLGIRGSSTCQLLFEQCRVPRANLLGAIGEGFRIAMVSLDGGRIGIAAQAVGIARAALEASLEYARGRVQFGRPIAAFQAIQFLVADMATRIDAARLLTYRAACLRDSGVPYTTEGSMAKLTASEVAMWVTTKAIQIYGGYGYITDYPVQRHFRDAKVTEIYEGTSEIQRLVIAGHLLE
jgi:alkylation response protein AidB-like acyl-CoA dehydrogenase